MSEKETKKIQLSVLKQQVEVGMKKDELAVYYGLPVTQMTKVLQQAGLKIRKFHKPAFVLENDLEATEKVDNLQSVSSTESVEEKVEESISETTTTEDFSSVDTSAPAPWSTIEEEEAPETLGDALGLTKEADVQEDKVESAE